MAQHPDEPGAVARPRRRPVPDLGGGRERRLVLAASTGGHLAQLTRLAPGLGASPDSLWITFRSAQSESLLAGRNVLFAPYIKPRDGLGVVKAFGCILARLRAGSYDAAVSTGAALALAALPAARLARIPSLYVESVSRISGPSLSGRILAGLNLAEMRTQHASWAGGRWGVHPSVLSSYCELRKPAPSDRDLRLFITLGTLRGYSFDALVDRVLSLELANEHTVWQVGNTVPRSELPGTVHREVSTAQFERYATEADVVITHAGVGSVLGLLELGISPVAVVRRRFRGEHVDDHQQQLAELMRSTGVGHPVELDDLGPEVIAAAAACGVSTLPAAQPGT